jgi:probable rRNA maturation factor
VDPDSNRVTRPRRSDGSGRRQSGSSRVTVTDGRGRSIADTGLARWLAAFVPPHTGDVAVALVSDRQIQKLNQVYRGKNRPTDVLSFPANGQPRPTPQRRPPSADPRAPSPDAHLGDIVIATGVAKRQARQAGHAYRTELRVLALHGLLHLLGYDHDHPDDRGRMARAEARLRRKGGLREGLISRNRAPTVGRRRTR